MITSAASLRDSRPEESERASTNSARFSTSRSATTGSHCSEPVTGITRCGSSPKGLPFIAKTSDRGGVHGGHDERRGS